MSQELHKDFVQKYTDLSQGFIINRARTIKKRDFSKMVNDAMAKTDPAKIVEGKPFRYRNKLGKEVHSKMQKIDWSGLDYGGNAGSGTSWDQVFGKRIK